MNRLQKVVDLRLGSRDRRLDAALRRALLAEMQLSYAAPFDLGELDYSLAIFAQIANHLYDDLVNLCTTQFAAVEQQHLIRSRRE